MGALTGLPLPKDTQSKALIDPSGVFKETIRALPVGIFREKTTGRIFTVVGVSSHAVHLEYENTLFATPLQGFWKTMEHLGVEGFSSERKVA